MCASVVKQTPAAYEYCFQVSELSENDEIKAFRNNGCATLLNIKIHMGQSMLLI